MTETEPPFDQDDEANERLAPEPQPNDDLDGDEQGHEPDPGTDTQSELQQ